MATATRTTRAASRAGAASSPAKKATSRPQTPKSSRAKKDPEIKVEKDDVILASANTSRKRKSTETNATPSKKAATQSTPASKRSRNTSSSTKKAEGPSEADLAHGAKMASEWTKHRDDQFADATSTPTKSPAKNTKSNPYNLTPGTSPYPTYVRPTPSECQHITDILSAIHGRVSAPKTVPVPSLNSSGCGEVPSVLDALIRTRLSAATNNENSSRAFRGLVSKFGVIKEGVGKGSVDWNKVRLADQSDIFEAIKTGGLAQVKSRDIKNILQSVYEENQALAREAQESNHSSIDKNAYQNNNAVEKAQAQVISLDHLHALDSTAAFNKLVQYPGIGPKTASCVLLFCMQRPSFAVDTHVFRLTRWLEWTPSDAELKRIAKEQGMSDGAADEITEKSEDVKKDDGEDVGVKMENDESTTPSKKKKSSPPTRPRMRGPPPVTRNSTYSHLDVRIPDELKYPLHYLLIKHGKMCPECSAKPDRAIKEAWGNKKCPLREFKSGGKGGARNGVGKRKPKKEEVDSGEEEEELVEEEDETDNGEDDDEGSEEEE